MKKKKEIQKTKITDFIKRENTTPQKSTEIKEENNQIEIPNCDHNELCVRRVSKKEGENNGKAFFVCAKNRDDQCKYFKWESDLLNQINTPKSSQEKIDIPRCSGHNEICAKRVVKKEGANNGKTFYVCPKNKDEQCKFFLWESEIGKQNSTPTKKRQMRDNDTSSESQETSEKEKSKPNEKKGEEQKDTEMIEEIKNSLKEESWKEALKNEFEKLYFKKITKFVANEIISGKTIFPPKDLIFNALNLCPLDNVKVLILGQDPYINVGQANGLAFSVNYGITHPPSLKNIFKELQSNFDDFEIPSHGNLTHWSEQGVLLLNACLTVESGKSNSHANKGWETLTDCIISTVSKQRTGVYFLLWGAYAQKKKSLIDKKKHFILECAHPSPLSASKGFFGCQHFKKVNDGLGDEKKIDWSLPKQSNKKSKN